MVLLLDLSLYSIFLPLLAGLYKFKSLSYTLKVLLIYIVISTISEILGEYLWQHGLNNVLVINIFIFSQFNLLAYIYYIHFKNYQFSKLLPYCIITFTIFAIINAFWLENIFRTLNSNTLILSGFILIILSIVFFHKSMTEENNEKSTMFWISSAILFYFFTNMFIFIFDDIFNDITLRPYSISLWSIHAIINIITNVLFIIAFLKSRRYDT